MGAMVEHSRAAEKASKKAKIGTDAHLAMRENIFKKHASFTDGVFTHVGKNNADILARAGGSLVSAHGEGSFKAPSGSPVKAIGDAEEAPTPESSKTRLIEIDTVQQKTLDGIDSQNELAHRLVQVLNQDLRRCPLGHSAVQV